jgi:hypothetical protein
LTISSIVASSGTFSRAEVIGLFAFFVDLGLGPISALILVAGVLVGNSGRGWAIVLGVTAGLNLAVSSAILLTVGDGLAPIGWVIVLQAVVSAAVLVIVMRRPWRAVVFGRRTAKS